MKLWILCVGMAMPLAGFAEENAKLHSPFQEASKSRTHDIGATRLVDVVKQKAPIVTRGKDGNLEIVANRIYQRPHPTNPKKVVFELSDSEGRLHESPRWILISGSTFQGEWLGDKKGTRWLYRSGKQGWESWKKVVDVTELSEPGNYFVLVFTGDDKESEVLNFAHSVPDYDPEVDYKPVSVTK